MSNMVTVKCDKFLVYAVTLGQNPIVGTVWVTSGTYYQ
jgi:hypothetical protein